MRIALIYPPKPYLVEPNAQLPIGLSYLSAMIKAYTNVHVDIINLSDKTIEEGWNDLEEYDFYGYTCTTIDYPIVEKLATLVWLKYPKSIQAIGGSHPTLALRYIDWDHFDVAFIGEAENSIIEFIADWHNGKIKKVYESKPIQDLDTIPFPDRAAYKNLPSGKVFIDQEGDSTVIIASRGCYWDCSFCASRGLWGKGVRWRSVDNVIAEIKSVIDEYSIYNFRFSDDNMVANNKFLFEFCKKVTDLGIKWRLSARVDCLTDEKLKAMKEAGCVEISLGVESFDSNVLKLMNKSIIPAKSIDAIKRVKRHGIKIRILFMISTPGETIDTVDENIKGLEEVKNDFDLIGVKTFVPLPGTPIFNNPEKYGVKIISKDFDKYNYFMYENEDGEAKEIEPYSNITIEGMSREQQINNIIKMREYIKSIPQNHKG